ncbi:transcription factor FER-LIKE IRON DEFICIENCY-INDUCED TRANSCRIPTION FACTOR-like [Rhododendron vialii]|uniref:transcription factor FER-LIKE IRON DEFICIENCY-INDUCED TRANSCRIPTION FACTOR-like n=1 Tax=Rhododendron vialii TaxID=182163 RepID=UPI00265F411A|nr:transcription factor FER-LIKE IRON DEFICIENCY-INDUCED TRANSCRIPTION FACTOR-like [Rhododendron vialii]
MERDTSGNQLGHIMGDFNPLLGLMDETNFLQFIDIIRGESSDPVAKFCANFDCEHIGGCLVDNQFESSTQLNPFDHFHTDQSVSNHDSDLIINTVLQLATDADEEENDNHEESSTTTTTIPSTKRKGGDRSRTLVSERRRRGRMKEKLYALRALVPNITKMDKASIVGDALLYLQDLQTQAKKLRSEIAGLESSLGGREKNQRGIAGNQKNTQYTNTDHPICKNIFQLDMFQVEERGFYARVECNRGRGVAPSLYRAVESLTRLNVPSSNLGTRAERFILTFNLKVKECEPDTNLQKLKLGLTEALLKQGFVFQTQASA